MYWIFATEAQNERQARIHGRPEAITSSRVRFGRGLLVSTDVPLIEIVVKPEHAGEYTDNLIALGTTGLVFNSKLRSIMTEAGVDNLQFFNSKIVDQASGQINYDYVVVNIIGRLDCIDFRSSELEIHNGSIEFIRKLVLDENRIQGQKMFRLADFLPIVAVDDKVRSAVKSAGCTGVNFYKPEDYIL